MTKVPTKKHSKKEKTEPMTPKEGITRRGFIKACAATGVAGFAGATGFGLIESLFVRKKEGGVEVSNTFVYYASSIEKSEKKLWYIDKIGEVIKPEDLKVGEGASSLWRGTLPAIVIKLEKSKVKDASDMLEVDDGYICAYFAKCPHLCCIPGWKKDRPDLEVIYCPCHEGEFDAYDRAKVLAGPPPAPLPAIKLTLEDGEMIGLPTNLNEMKFCGE